MAEFPIDPSTGMPIVHIDEQQQMERYLAEIAMEDILLSSGERTDKSGTLARYKARVQSELAEELESIAWTPGDISNRMPIPTEPFAVAMDRAVNDAGPAELFAPSFTDFEVGVWTPLAKIILNEVRPERQYLLFEADHPSGPIMLGRLSGSNWIVPDLQTGEYDFAKPTHLMPVPSIKAKV